MLEMLEKQDPCGIPTGVCRESIFLKDIKVVGILATVCTVVSMSYQLNISVGRVKPVWMVTVLQASQQSLCRIELLRWREMLCTA